MGVEFAHVFPDMLDGSFAYFVIGITFDRCPLVPLKRIDQAV